MDKKKITIGVLVSNQSGVLNRVSSLFARRGFNIDSLTVGETENPKYSRITVTATGDGYVENQIIKQLKKLIDIKKVLVMETGNTIHRELLLIKVNAEPGSRSEILEAVQIYRANVVDLSQNALTIELTGESSKINSFIENMRVYGICEMCRTGVSAMERSRNLCVEA